MQKWARLLYQPGVPLYGDTRVTGSKEHIDISKRAADEAVVLLKNENDLLPLSGDAPVAMFGKASYEYIKGGGGSGDVFCKYIRSLYDGLKERGVRVYEPVIEYYRQEIEKQYEAGRAPGMTAEPDLSEDMVKGARNFADTAIIVINRFSGEGWDRSKVESPSEFSPWPAATSMPTLSGEVFPDGDFVLTAKEKEMVSKVTASFDRVIAVLNIGGTLDLRWVKEDAKIGAALYMGQLGMEGGLATADVLLGKVCPSGRLSDTFAGTLEDYPSTEGFHESYEYVDYSEDVYVGYRYFETVPGAAEKVVYPFGYGLSYTSFDMEVVDAAAVKEVSGLKKTVNAADFTEGNDGFCFTVKVTNTGKVAGKEVVQLYYSAPQGLLKKPARELGDFAKTRVLAPGEAQLLTLSVSKYELSSYDDLGKVSDASYVLEKGVYSFYIGENVRNLTKTDFEFNNEEDKVIQKLSHKLASVELKKRMLADGSFEELPVGEHKDINTCIFEKMEPGTEEALVPAVRGRDSYFLTYPYKEGAKTFAEVAEGKVTLDEFMAQLSDEDLIHLCGGQPNTGVGNVFGFGNLPEYGVPNAVTADGPAGVRIQPETGVKTTAFPCATSLACTWNKDLVEEVGFAGGEELKENNLCVWLTPAINIHRSPMCGRNFEYYSEDPYLTGRLAGAMVRGIQRNNVGASVKHFACNNKETNRKHCDSRVSERALREIYLKAFEMIVHESAPYTIMSSYNVINGERASESHDLITGILKEEWGFTGFVTTDWWTRGEHYKEIKAGNDLKMACGFPERVKKAQEMGAVNRADFEQCARRILATILKFD
ncbi:glycoside hydrolase family 3 protein [Butyrivibrio sp. AE3009]|uniref:glycoside hydrolase family 3 protein n=1 Tax=Butyrivibrio sp. AE3009 TaxID=1280666 RepID=UPI0003B76634|nr:glycoside hydrolase family 3 protein [Butyrivibrio sp. AE3009]